VNAPLTNWSSGTLTGGTYKADSTLTLSSIGSGQVGTISGATVTLNGTGLISGNGSTSALAGLNNITSSSLNLNGVSSLTITPSSGTLSITAPDSAFTNSALNVAASNLTVNGTITTSGGGAQTSTVSVSNGGTLHAAGLTNAGIVAVDATSTADFRSGTVGSFGSLSANGTLSGNYQIGGGFYYDPGLGGGAIKTIAAGASVEIDGSGFMRYGAAGTDGLASLTVNNGTFTAGQGASVALNGPLTQNGSLNVTGGSTFSAQGLNNQGLIIVEAGSTADFRTGSPGASFANLSGGTLSGGSYQIGGNFHYDPSVAGAGGGDIRTIGANTTLQIDGAGQMLYGNNVNGLAHLGTNSGNLILNQSAALSIDGPFGQAGGTLSLTGSSLTVGGVFTQDSASQASVLQGSSLNAHGLNNQGLLVVDAGSTADFRGGSFANFSGGVLSGGSYKIGGNFVYDAPGGMGNITTINSGTTVELDGAGQLAFGSGANPTNGILGLTTNKGTLVLGQDINGVSASLSLAGGLAQAGGNLQLVNGSSLTLGGQFTQDSLSHTQIQAFSTVSAQGLNNAGSITVDSSSVANFATGNATGTFANLSSDGTLHGGTYKVAGSFLYDPYAAPGGANAGGDILRIGTGTAVEIDGFGAMLYNQSVNGLSNLARNSGTLTLSSDDVGFSAELVLNGDFAQQGGTLRIENGSELVVAGRFSQDANSTTDVSAFSVLAAGDGFLNEGTLTGTGEIDGDLVNEGIDNPGDPGTQTITGSYDQTAAGMLVLEFAGDDPLMSLYDNLSIGGDVTLAGTLGIEFAPGFIPVVGDQFKILSWGGILTGNFANFNFAPLAAGLHFVEVVDSNDIMLEVVAPEPSTLALLLPILLGMTAWPLRRRLSRRQTPLPGRVS
jgi:hypothetical protein